jgi:hypothetical protein
VSSLVAVAAAGGIAAAARRSPGHRHHRLAIVVGWLVTARRHWLPAGWLSLLLSLLVIAAEPRSRGIMVAVRIGGGEATGSCAAATCCRLSWLSSPVTAYRWRMAVVAASYQYGGIWRRINQTAPARSVADPYGGGGMWQPDGIMSGVMASWRPCHIAALAAVQHRAHGGGAKIRGGGGGGTGNRLVRVWRWLAAFRFTDCCHNCRCQPGWVITVIPFAGGALMQLAGWQFMPCSAALVMLHQNPRAHWRRIVCKPTALVVYPAAAHPDRAHWRRNVVAAVAAATRSHIRRHGVRRWRHIVSCHCWLVCHFISKVFTEMMAVVVTSRLAAVKCIWWRIANHDPAREPAAYRSGLSLFHWSLSCHQYSSSVIPGGGGGGGAWRIWRIYMAYGVVMAVQRRKRRTAAATRAPMRTDTRTMLYDATRRVNDAARMTQST